MLRAVFLLHICSNYYIYVVEHTKALELVQLYAVLCHQGRSTCIVRVAEIRRPRAASVREYCMPCSA